MRGAMAIEGCCKVVAAMALPFRSNSELSRVAQAWWCYTGTTVQFRAPAPTNFRSFSVGAAQFRG